MIMDCWGTQAYDFSPRLCSELLCCGEPGRFVLLRVCVLETLSWGHGDGSSWVKGLGSHLCNWESHSKPKGNKRQKTSEHLPLFQGVLDVFVSPIAHTEISRLLLMESPIPILWESVGVFVHVSGLWISPRKTGFINTGVADQALF